LQLLAVDWMINRKEIAVVHHPACIEPHTHSRNCNATNACFNKDSFGLCYTCPCANIKNQPTEENSAIGTVEKSWEHATDHACILSIVLDVFDGDDYHGVKPSLEMYLTLPSGSPSPHPPTFAHVSLTSSPLCST